MPSPIRIKLSSKEKQALKHLKKCRIASNQAERAYYVLLCDQGFSVGEMAKQLDRNPHTIRCWLKRYLSQGISGLSDIKGAGRPRNLREEAKKHLLKLLNHSPKQYGYQPSGWQINLLIEQLSKKIGSASEKTVIRALHELGWVYKRFSKTLPLDAPTKDEKQGCIKNITEAIKKEQSKGECEVLFCDESHFSNQPYVQRGWFKRGEKKRVPTQKRKSSNTIFGALSLQTQKFYWKQAEKGSSKVFIQFLHQFRQKKPGKKLLLVLDNGSIHKSNKVKKFLAKNNWIELFFLPPYSPEYNPIEMFWQWLKRKAYGANGYRYIEQLIGKVRKLIWHYNEKLLAKSIEFEFKAYKSLL